MLNIAVSLTKDNVPLLLTVAPEPALLPVASYMQGSRALCLYLPQFAGILRYATTLPMSECAYIMMLAKVYLDSMPKCNLHSVPKIRTDSLDSTK